MMQSRRIDVKVISLESAVERRDFLSKNLKFSSSMPWSFFNANAGSDDDPNLISDQELQRVKFGRCLSAGEVGCFRSHHSVICEFLSSGTADWLLVLEDDVWIDGDFDFEELVEFLDGRAIDYIRLFAKMFKPADVVAELNGLRQIIRFRTDPYGTQAYLINKRGCESFLRDLRYITAPIDDELGRFWRHKLDPYCVFPFPAVERNTESSLEKFRNNGVVVRKSKSFLRIRSRVVDNLKKRSRNLHFAYRKKLRLL